MQATLRILFPARDGSTSSASSPGRFTPTLTTVPLDRVGRDSVVGIATRYGPDGQWIESVSF
jgi:hypothetical protein